MVKVLEPETAGTDSVTVPDVSPDKTSELIYFLLDQRTTQRAPVGIVTVMPLLMVIGPTECALFDVLSV